MTSVTLIPANRAAVGLMPTDWTNRPILVFFMSTATSRTIASAMKILVGNGMPGRKPAMYSNGL